MMPLVDRWKSEALIRYIETEIVNPGVKPPKSNSLELPSSNEITLFASRVADYANMVTGTTIVIGTTLSGLGFGALAIL